MSLYRLKHPFRRPFFAEVRQTGLEALVAGEASAAVVVRRTARSTGSLAEFPHGVRAVIETQGIPLLLVVGEKRAQADTGQCFVEYGTCSGHSCTRCIGSRKRKL